MLSVLAGRPRHRQLQLSAAKPAFTAASSQKRLLCHFSSAFSARDELTDALRDGDVNDQDVDPLHELGERRMVGGQEDMIVDVALDMLAAGKD